MEWKVPLAEVYFGEEEQEAVRRVLRSGWVSMGPETERFEYEFSDYLGIKHALAVSSGTAALHLSLLALGIGPGDEVIVPSLTFVATANAVIYVGATPVFADVTSLNDWNIDPDDIKQKITSRTKAIIVVHYAGFPCRMDAITKLTEFHKIALIEDAAHGSGAAFQGRKLGTWGDFGCFSFFSNKNMTTAEGGMVVTNSSDEAKKLKTLRSHGMTSLTWDRHRGHSFSYDVVATGYNYRLDEMRSALGRVQLGKLEENNQNRRRATVKMRKYLNELKEISVPYTDEMIRDSSCHIFPVLLKKGIRRTDLMTYMNALGIQTSIHYPPVHLFSAYRLGISNSDGLELTEDIASREITLPLYPRISNEQIRSIVTELKNFLVE